MVLKFIYHDDYSVSLPYHGTIIVFLEVPKNNMQTHEFQNFGIFQRAFPTVKKSLGSVNFFLNVKMKQVTAFI